MYIFLHCKVDSGKKKKIAGTNTGICSDELLR